MSGWVAPSPLFDGQFLCATSGRDGPLVLWRRGGLDVDPEQSLVWRQERGGPYVCSPILYQGRLYVHDERGILACYDAATGERRYRERLDGRFYASAVAAAGRVYLSNDAGVTYVVRSGDTFEILARNDLQEEILASPAITHQTLWLRTRTRLICIGE
jgi:outer membrane protein assembly factor BamB